MSYTSNDEDDGELFLFPITDICSFESESETSSHHDESESARDASGEEESSDEDLFEEKQKKAFLTLRQRRLSRALETFEKLKVNVSSAKMNWIKAIRKARELGDPWGEFHLEQLEAEKCLRHRYNALKKKWVIDEVTVKMQKKSFNRGAMRTCYRLRKLSNYHGEENWQHTHNFVAKKYIEDVEREVYFQDVKLQMDAKLWGEEYSRHNPPKKVDIFQMYILEFKDRSGAPLYHCEHFIEGEYIKYNSNSGFVEKNLRNTPQAFSHFTFERSGHQLIVVDIQGVGDLYTDPQVHTLDGKEYGDGNLGAKGMALFFYSHVCNDICASLGLSEFDLSETELIGQKDTISMQKIVAHTMARGCEEMCLSPSPGQLVDVTNFLQYKRQRSTSSNASDSGMESMLSPLEEEPMSIGSPVGRFRSRYISESESSLTSQGRGRRDSCLNHGEEDIQAFRMHVQQMHRPSCVALEKDFRKLNLSRINDSALGKVHHELAKYHEIGRFCDKDDALIDWQSALFHEEHAAELGEMEAILTLAKMYLGQERDVLMNCTVQDEPDNLNRGMDYMVQAADAGDRGSMVYVARAFETGTGLGDRRSKSWEDAVYWYDEAVQHSEHDEGGEYDSTMYDPDYQLMAKQAEMLAQGGHGLEKLPNRAGELYNEAAEAATAAMKGRLASKYFALAEEAWAECEEE